MRVVSKRILDSVLRRGFALLLGLAIVFARAPFSARLGAEAPFLFTWVAIFCTAWLGGVWTAVAVAAVGLTFGQYLLVTHGVPPIRPGAMVVLAIFAGAFILPGAIYRWSVRKREQDAERYAELQLRMSQVARLNAMGELVGTLAHELNQPLTAILSYADAALYPLQPEDERHQPLRELIGKIVKQGQRARDIIARVRGQVSGAGLELQPQSLARLVEEAVELSLASAVRDSVVVKVELAHGADCVLADRIEIEQVMVNLIRNAAEAMAGEPRREVRIGSRVSEDGMVTCHVADSGPGISPDVLPNLFQPFATGKENGMGIGLAVSRSIVEAHGGRIWADSQPGRGATFFFTLSRAQVGAAA